MEVAEKVKKILNGGEFLVSESAAQEVFTPEDLNEEQLMFANMAKEYLEKHIWPNVIRIDKQEPGLTVQLMDIAGELGLLGAAIPEEYGGMGIDLNTETLLTEVLGASHSFGVSLAAHTGIGTLPVLYFGTAEQKQQYLPKLATGEIKAAYCLTEPGSGSDALAARTKATLQTDENGQEYYLLEGQKMWITNSGFANLFTVFAKIDGKLFTGFLVDANSPNIRLGNEEDKMGIKGSSTRQVFFEGVKVPKENVLGKIGEGHKIAFNVLNIGRFKLGVMVCGGAKRAFEMAIKYANERQQFGQSISNFGAIKHKLAEQAIRIFALESVNYRVSDLLHQKIASLVTQGTDEIQAKLIAAEEYAIECSILKVFGSEVLDFVVDEAVQIYGGNGFSEEYPIARAYRDSRINRIFEGTNEINRLLTVDMLLKKAMRGELDLMTPAMAVQKELMSIPDFGADDDDTVFAAEKKALRNAKKAVLMIAGFAVQKFMQKLAKEQEIIMSVTDMLIEILACESAMLRTEKLINLQGEQACETQLDMVRTLFSDGMERINLHGKHAICAFTEGDEQQMMLMGLKRFTKYQPYNTVAARRRIADKVIAAEKYCF
ncbi:MAG TPA: acyl-CoA dehydrogenase family protein [Chitinophagales bacterium]|nr:acyl-CoA dehydrogenase family protein [Chitinophagales bacterium]HRK26254.1 acyl-CoA dehydrogenase family protein [Chitinophagales bacterium]